MTRVPTAKHIAYKGRRYRIAQDGTLQQWRALDDSYTLAWRSFIGPPELEKIVRSLLAR